MFKVKGSPVKSASPRLNGRCPDEILSEFHWAGIQLDKYFTGQEFKHRQSCKLKAQRKKTREEKLSSLRETVHLLGSSIY